MLNAQLSVFSDSYGVGATFFGFGGAINNVTIDNSVAYSGTSSIKIDVPSSSYTGGAFKAAAVQNLSTYNAISFWAKADANKTLNVSGISNNGVAAVFQAEYNNIALTTTWTKFIIPIPSPGKLSAEDGLFHFAEGSDEGAYTIWLDDIQYESSTSVGTFSPAMATQTITPLAGGTFTPQGTVLNVLVNSVNQTINVKPACFDFTSSDNTVATVTNGVGTANGSGSATITAMLNGVASAGVLTVNVAAAAGPTSAAPTPINLPANVISLYSNAYTNVTGTNWNPNWGQSTIISDVMLFGDQTKKYENLNYQGIELIPALDVSTMQYLHFDIWTPNAAAFDVFLINPGPIEQMVRVNPTASGWNSYDIPLTSYNTINLANVFQMKLVGTPFGTSLIYLDNLYFYKTVGSTSPTLAAPTPTRAPANVLSLFSNAYTDIAGTNWNPSWGQSTVVTDVTIVGNATKKYENLNYQGIVFNSTIDASAMEYLHFDLWTTNCTAFEMFLVNPGPVEQGVTVNPTASGWNSFDIPLTSYNTITLNNIFQMKLVGTPFGTSNVWLDNIYFYKNPPTAPTTAAPTPTRLPVNVLSLFSNAYTDVAGTNWNPNWGQSTQVTDVMVAGNDTKKYANLNYQGVLLNPATDASAMEYVHFDLWTTNCTTFEFFLINPGGVEQAVAVTPTAFGWNSFDIPLTSYNTINLTNIFQMKLVGTPFGTSNVWLDNIYFYRNPTVVPLTAAPTPTRPAAFVKSLFSNAYTNVVGTDWNPNWGQSTQVTDVMIAGNETKKYENLNYQGILLNPALDVTGMEYLHFDLWTPNCTTFEYFLVNPGPIEQAVAVTPTAFGWNSFDIPLTSYNTIALNNIFQMKLVGTPFGTSNVWLDNIYFYKNPPTAPLTAAPTPTRPVANVLSLFSNAYTDKAGTDWNPNWGQSTQVTDVQIAGNDTKRYTNLNYQGVLLNPAADASSMQYLHFDLWTTNSTSFEFFLINPGGIEQAVAVTPTTYGWNSFDIPLTSYNTINKSNIFQLKLVGTPFGSSNVWLDNIYFYKEPITLTGKVFLNHVNNGLMNDYLPNLSNFPLSDPYSTNPLSSNFTHVNNGSTQTTTPTVLAANNGTSDDIVDWIFLELRDGVSGSTSVLYTQAALLQSDGDIVNAANGLTAVEFPNAPAGNYYVTVRHRDHTGFRTANKIAISGNTALLNFTNNSVALFGAYSTTSVGTAQAMNGGDSNSDGSIDAFDTIVWETQNGLFDDYTNNSDYNLDGSVDAFDTIIWELNNGKYQELD
jgi:hypothetical protein